MNTIIGSTTSETNMIKAIQRAVGAAEDGMIGGETMAAVAAKLGADCFPLTLRIYGQPTIIARDIVVCNPRAGLKGYSNSLSGSFSYRKQPCSILVSWGKAVCESACHAWLGQPETVLYRLYSGEFGIQRCMSSQGRHGLPDLLRRHDRQGGGRALPEAGAGAGGHAGRRSRGSHQRGRELR